MQIEFREVTKKFESHDRSGGILANDRVSFTIRSGTIHAMVGENGAGKSTAMNLLFGLHQPTSGQIFLNQEPVHIQSPQDAVQYQIGMVHQHFMLAKTETVLDHIVLQATSFNQQAGVFSKWISHVLLRTHSVRERLQQIMKQYALPVPLDARIDSLSVGLQQRVEILKLLFLNANVLIFDEPTAVLIPQEAKQLLENLIQLKNEGKTIIIVTHKLKEVMSCADDITVMKQGKVVKTLRRDQTQLSELSFLMVGQELQPLPERKEAIGHHQKCGEIIGIAGVEGNGQEALVHSLVFGESKNHQERNQNLGYVPGDRHREAVLLDENLIENCLLTTAQHFTSSVPSFFKVIRRQQVKKEVDSYIHQYDIRPAHDETSYMKMSSFSGGNQQKFVLAREMEQHPQTLVLCHPTRGVDIGAIDFIHRRILKARDEGATIYVVSSELDELLALSDQLWIIVKGTIVQKFSRHQLIQHSHDPEFQTQLGLLMSGSILGGVS
jgi:simple sugar transport system ATP-binding protein